MKLEFTIGFDHKSKITNMEDAIELYHMDKFMFKWMKLHTNESGTNHCIPIESFLQKQVI
jgi:hypothetical protein